MAGVDVMVRFDNLVEGIEVNGLRDPKTGRARRSSLDSLYIALSHTIHLFARGRASTEGHERWPTVLTTETHRIVIYKRESDEQAYAKSM
jgi:hypothetical protein